ncbi:signal-regulatory protein beta-2-like [Oreochromis aureus]|uniref:signal-regulatory protein beta-2-like n=1 Tax=Oreochromis aureus TaxID=47969 RepID=UPI001953DEEF|nr:signal-regulatory protein beta-2-like [Oreochromis aureus]
MVVLWMMLLVLHQGDSLVPVKMVQLGEPATLKCDIPKEISSKVYWYRQSVGDTLKLIVTLYRDTEPVYDSASLKSRFSAKNANNFSKLTILETVQEDEGIYHCGMTAWHNLEWSGTYLLVKGKTERTSNYIVVQQPIESNPVRPGTTANLQCSVLSDSENKTCPGDDNVFWFRSGSNKSHPNIIYTDGNRTNRCEKRSDHQKRCFYQLSKNVSSSDAGTYYCAVATCGEILFGNGTTLDIQESSVLSQTASTVVFLLSAVMCISLFIIAVLIYITKKNNSDHHKAPGNDQKTQQDISQIKDTQMFSAVVFAVIKVDICTTKVVNAAEEQQIYTAVKAFGLD